MYMCAYYVHVCTYSFVVCSICSITRVFCACVHICSYVHIMCMCAGKKCFLVQRSIRIKVQRLTTWWLTRWVTAAIAVQTYLEISYPVYGCTQLESRRLSLTYQISTDDGTPTSIKKKYQRHPAYLTTKNFDKKQCCTRIIHNRCKIQKTTQRTSPDYFHVKNYYEASLVL